MLLPVLDLDATYQVTIDAASPTVAVVHLKAVTAGHSGTQGVGDNLDEGLVPKACALRGEGENGGHTRNLSRHVDGLDGHGRHGAHKRLRWKGACGEERCGSSE